MKVFLVERIKNVNWEQDYAMVVIAEDERHAERRARISSEYFKNETIENIEITEFDTNKEQCVLIANTGA